MQLSNASLKIDTFLLQANVHFIFQELCCPDLHPDQPFEDLYHKCESHLHPPPHCCIFEVFDGGLSPVGSDVDEDVEMFEIRPGATKWIFDGEDLDAPEPKIGKCTNRCSSIIVVNACTCAC